MKMLVVTTITSTLDVDTMGVEHKVEIDDRDGLANVHRDVLGSLVIGALRATTNGIYEQFPHVKTLADNPVIAASAD